MTDYKEYAKQMRENAVKNEQGNIVCSPELWEEIASVIERAILPPCKVGDTVYCKYWNGGFVKCTVSMITQQVDKPLKLRLSANGSVSIEYTVNDFGKTVFLTKEEAEKALAERSSSNGKL